jgi:hypothetical protein
MIRKAWTAYAALLTGAVVLGETANLVQGGTVGVRTFANWSVTAVLLLATWGYALQRAIGAQYYWRGASWVVVGASLVTAIPAVLAGGAALMLVAVLVPLLVPAFVAIFLYAYRSPQVWQTVAPAAIVPADRG